MLGKPSVCDAYISKGVVERTVIATVFTFILQFSHALGEKQAMNPGGPGPGLGLGPPGGPGPGFGPPGGPVPGFGPPMPGPSWAPPPPGGQLILGPGPGVPVWGCGFCGLFRSCLYFLCCCFLIEDCCAPLFPRGPPGPLSPPGLP